MFSELAFRLADADTLPYALTDCGGKLFDNDESIVGMKAAWNANKAQKGRGECFGNTPAISPKRGRIRSQTDSVF
jgi:hypothetical protein